MTGHRRPAPLAIPTALRFAGLLAAMAAAGCTTDDKLRIDGVTLSAGEAIEINSALQVIDPSPPGARDTRIRVPAVRPPSAASADGSSAGSASTDLAGPKD